IAAQSTGFIYVVSRLGVTGANSEPSTDALRAQIGMLRGVSEKPLAVGFGVSAPAHVRAVAPLADGIIVGSALIDAYAGTSGKEAASRAERFVDGLIAAASRRIA
ncbi:MAG TPA: tryptophan synthase subunit alpha, partial [Candidatus Lustribacter sp.]